MRPNSLTGKNIGIDVLDHIIIGKEYCSLKEKGYI